jgi:acid phosphatase type 7
VYYRPSAPPLATPLAAVTGAALSLAAPPWKVQPTTPKPYPMTDFKVFRAELTGLAPGTDYDFRVGRQSPVYRFRTMPAKMTDTIQFVSGGDCGVNAHTVANNIQAARQNPAFAVVGGDLGYDNGTSVEVSLAFIRNYSKHMVGKNGRLIPLIPCIGNHEVAGGYGKKRDKAPFFYALFDGLFTETGYTTLEFGNYLSLVLLDTGHTSPIGEDQAAWLDTTLKTRRDHPHVFVVNHVPAYPSVRRMDGTLFTAGTGEPNRRHWVPLFEKYRVPVVLEHHDHTFKRTKPLIGGLAHDDGVLYLGDGSWGRLRAPQKPEKLHHLAASSEEYHLSLHRIQGEERFHLALGEDGQVMDVCRSGQRKTGSVSTGD